MTYSLNSSRYLPRTLAVAVTLLMLTFHAEAEPRVFTSNSGQVFKGELVSTEGEMVTIKREDGQVFTLKGVTFCKADQDYFQERGFRPGEPEKRPGADSPWVDLLPDLHKHEKQNIIKGSWRFSNGALISSGKGQERIEIPAQIPEEYDYKVVFTEKGTNCVIQILTHQGVPFIWVMGVDGDYFFRYLDKDFTVRHPGLKAGQTYTSIVRVRNEGVEIELDGQVIFRYDTDYQNGHPRPFWAMKDKFHLGLGCADCQTEFRSVEMRPAEGHKEKK